MILVSISQELLETHSFKKLRINKQYFLWSTQLAVMLTVEKTCHLALKWKMSLGYWAHCSSSQVSITKRMDS